MSIILFIDLRRQLGNVLVKVRIGNSWYLIHRTNTKIFVQYVDKYNNMCYNSISQEAYYGKKLNVKGCNKNN
jgi:hypothetical protein